MLEVSSIPPLPTWLHMPTTNEQQYSRMCWRDSSGRLGGEPVDRDRTCEALQPSLAVGDLLSRSGWRDSCIRQPSIPSTALDDWLPLDPATNLSRMIWGRARYLLMFPVEFGAYVLTNRAWWIVPVFLLLALTTLVVVVGQVVAPFTLYSFF